jgi:uncharacterized protein
LACLDQEAIQILEEIKKSPDYEANNHTYESMIEGGLIVGNNYSEILELSKEYENFKKGSGRSSFGFVVLPTINCIYECPYCYENKKQHQMSNSTAECVENFIINSIQDISSVAITWYGGEPLMAPNIIDKISQSVINYCDKTNKKYNSFIVTNGYLIDDATLEFFKRNRITGCQITLDGTEKTHNNKRFLKTTKTGTFKKTIESILKVLSIDMSVSIRINIDKNNLDEIDDLLCFLKQNGIVKVKISLGWLNAATKACAGIEKNCLTNEAYSLAFIPWMKLLKKYNFVSSDMDFYPFKSHMCSAIGDKALLIDSEGNICKCWDDIGNEENFLGDVQHHEKASSLVIDQKYKEWSPFLYESCRKCDITPICMGGCPFQAIKDSKPQCCKWKYILDEYLQNVISSFLEGKQTEKIL